MKWRTIDDNEKLEYWQKWELPKLKVADNDMTILWRKQRERKQEEEKMRREAIGEMTEDTGGESAEDEEEIKEREMLEEQERLKNFKEELQELEEQRATIPILFEGDWATGTQEQMRKLLLANNQLYHGLYDEEDKHIPLRTENRTAIDEDETSGTETDGERSSRGGSQSRSGTPGGTRVRRTRNPSEYIDIVPSDSVLREAWEEHIEVMAANKKEDLKDERAAINAYRKEVRKEVTREKKAKKAKGKARARY